MFEAYGPKSGIATSSLWFSFLRTGKKKQRVVCKTVAEAGKSCVFILEGAEKTRHTYTSLRCCSLENNALSSTCNLLWLRSL